MTEQRIYPLNPIHETTTRDGRKAWVAFYVPGIDYPWRGAIEGTGHIIECWRASGSCDDTNNVLSLATLPEIPAEAREPKPGEVWEMGNREPAIVTGEVDDKTWRYMGPAGRFVGERKAFRRPWPSDKPHGFEGLIEAILQAHGGKP